MNVFLLWPRLRPCGLALAALFVCTGLRGQPYPDCAQALIICNKETLHLQPVIVPGSDETELNDVSCFSSPTPGNAEAYSFWLRFTASTAGSFYFTATPDSADSDLDFALFRLPGGDCTQKVTLRCMTAGDITFPSPCMGPTGLQPGETDTVNYPGCSASTGQDNFLAPVELQVGETYALAINNFTEGAGFTVALCGTALLGCDTAVCTTLAAGEAVDGIVRGIKNLFPNPVRAGETVTLTFDAPAPGSIECQLYDLAGRLVHRQTNIVGGGANNMRLTTIALPPGLYRLLVNRQAVPLIILR